MYQDMDQTISQAINQNNKKIKTDNLFDLEFAKFQQLPTETKIEHFKQPNGKIFDMIISQQLNREIIDQIYALTNKLRIIAKSKTGMVFLKSLLPHKRAMLYFTQPSSRTFLSFENACHILGMETSEIRDTSVSSEVKGESEDDALRTFSSYTDLIIMRHHSANMAERASWLLNSFTNRSIPVINGGSGSDQHPTQAILDIYTLQKSFENIGGLDNKKIVFCGDLKRGRTARSLSYLMKNFSNIEIIYAAPKEFQMKEDVLAFLDSHKIKYTIEVNSLKNVIHDADAIYMTRIQDEHDTKKGDSNNINIDNFKLKLADIALMPSHTAIMHPFPRRDEIDVAIDQDERAKYWRQERNGMWTRAALIALIFNIEEEIFSY